MIFLGAGASKELGIPTLQDLSNKIFTELIESDYGQLVFQITNSLEEFGIKPDFEAVYSILEALQSPFESVKKADPLTAFLLRKKENLPQSYETKNLLENSRELLYQYCTLKRDKTNDILNIYDPLFETIKSHNIMDNYIFKGIPYNGYLDMMIATTNYDMALELYFMKKSIPFIDGYEINMNNPYIKKFKWEIMNDPFNHSSLGNQIKHLLIKLHGSIWQFVNNEVLIKTNNDPKNMSIDINVGKEMMIYPTKEKEILSWNYYQFFNLFKQIHWEKMLIIGYSFRDDPINTTIIDNMKYNKEAKLYVFNPHAEEVIKNLNYEIDEKRIIEMPYKFGTPEGKKAIVDMAKYIR